MHARGRADVRTYLDVGLLQALITDHVRSEREILNEATTSAKRTEVAAVEEHRVGARGGGAVVQCVGGNKQRSDFD